MAVLDGADSPPVILTDLTPPPDADTSPESPNYFISPVEPGIYVVNPLETEDVHVKTASQFSINTDITSDGLENGKTRCQNYDGIDRSLVYGVDENKERGNWTGQLDFVLSMLGYAVGLGNLWRFPYLCYRNGGGAFLIPYLIFMSLVGIPLFFMESALAQFCSCGPTTCWEFAPFFKGVGIAMCICSGLTSLYYNMIIAWCQFYLFASFASPLPWSGCDNKWNTKDCSLKLPAVDCTEGMKHLNGTCYVDGDFQGIWNTTLFTNVTGRQRVSPSEEYWDNYILGISDGVDNIGLPRWQLVLNLLLAWIVCFLCLIKGIKTTGKVVYFTAVFPYVVLLILFFRGVTLEGAGEGIKFYIIPDFEKLLDAKVWRDAAVQIFYSMGPGWGGLIALSSYNRFHNNVLRDTLIVSLGNCMTSIFGGFVIFSYIGFMAVKLNVKVEDVAKSGAGLVFVIYPEALNILPVSTLWAIIFFLMLITLGMDSQFATVETVLTGLCDSFPPVRKFKSLTIFGICCVSFLLGLPMTTRGGVYILQILDYYTAAWSLLFIGLSEAIAVTYVYGWRRFCKDIHVMIGQEPSIYFKFCWMVTCPLGITFILLFAWIDYTPVTYGEYQFPAWADVLGWLSALASVVFIPGVMIYRVWKEDDGDTLLEKIKLQLVPSRKWGPALLKHRDLVDYIPGFVLDPKKEKSYLNRGYSGSSLGEFKISGSQSSISTTGRTNISKSNVSSLSVASNMTYESTI